MLHNGFVLSYRHKWCNKLFIVHSLFSWNGLPYTYSLMDILGRLKSMPEKLLFIQANSTTRSSTKRKRNDEIEEHTMLKHATPSECVNSHDSDCELEKRTDQQKKMKYN